MDKKGWSVSVEREGQMVLVISESDVYGKEPDDADCSLIKIAAEHLLSFIGLKFEISEPPPTARADGDIPF